jgi:hypothetical protein
MEKNMRCRFAICAAIFAVIAMGTAGAAELLDRYIGKYPLDKVGGRSFYQLANVKKDFTAKFGARRWATILSYSTAGPIEVVDDADLGRVVVVWQCKPHDCPNQAVILLQPSGSVLGVCFAREMKGGAMKVEWLGPDKKVLPVSGNSCGHEAKGRVAAFKAATKG